MSDNVNIYETPNVIFRNEYTPSSPPLTKLPPVEVEVTRAEVTVTPSQVTVTVWVVPVEAYPASLHQ